MCPLSFHMNFCITFLLLKISTIIIIANNEHFPPPLSFFYTIQPSLCFYIFLFKNHISPLPFGRY
eukprot:UN01891